MIGKRLKKIVEKLLLIFSIPKKKKYVQFISQKILRTVKKQIILLMIPNEEKERWHYLAVKKIIAWLRGVTSKHHDDFYCLNFLYSFRTESKLKSHEKACKNKDFCGIVMPWGKDKKIRI